ncbi:MAG: tetratricopeptide repeat protein, partial [Methylocella sp.]
MRNNEELAAKIILASIAIIILLAATSKAIEIDPKDAGAYNNRGIVFFTDGKPAQGLPDVEKSLELHPDDPNALDTRGLIFEALGRK